MSYVMAVEDKEFGKLLGDVEAIKKDLSEVESDIKAMKSSVDGILTQIATVRGGMSVAIWASGVAGALFMFVITKIMPLLFGTLPKI